MLLDDDHTDQLMYSERGADHVYIPGHSANMVFLGSGTPGDWALGEFWGPVATETAGWLDHLSMGRTCLLATAADARKVVEITMAIERSLRTRKAVDIGSNRRELNSYRGLPERDKGVRNLKV